MPKFKLFQAVRVISIPERDAMVIRDERFRRAKIGDVGAVVEVLSDPIEHFFVEAVKPDGGSDWLLDFLPEELETA